MRPEDYEPDHRKFAAAMAILLLAIFILGGWPSLIFTMVACSSAAARAVHMKRLEARRAGVAPGWCGAACKWSREPTDNCSCVCRGEQHGSALVR